MSDTTTDAIDLDAVAARVDKAHDYVGKLCTGELRWTMTIPVDVERDTDTVIGAALNDAEALLAEVQRLRDGIDAHRLNHANPFPRWTHDEANERLWSLLDAR